MPCQGIAVLTALTEDVKEALRAVDIFAISSERIGNIVHIEAQVPLADGGAMPVKVAIEQDGRIAAITQTGTYELGVKTLQQLVVTMQALGVSIDDVNFESHMHDHQAPQMAYSQSAQY